VFLKNWANIFYALMGTSGTPTITDVSNMASALHTAYNTNLQHFKNSGSSLVETKIIYVPTPGSEVIGSHVLAIPGGGGGTPLSNQASLVVSWPISAYYRGGHPRTYFDGMETDYLSNPTTWLTIAQTDFETGAAAYQTAVNGYSGGAITGATLGTLSFATHNAWRPTPLFRPYGTSPLVHERVDTQRRRLGKEGV